MQKKLIILAVAGLTAMSAFAQSNIYGIVDNGSNWTGKSINRGIGRQWMSEDTPTTAHNYDPFDLMEVGSSWKNWRYDDQLRNRTTYAASDRGGFSFTTGYTLSGRWDEGFGNDGDIRVFAIAPQYSIGNFSIALSYHQAEWKQYRNTLGGEKVKVVDLSGSYDFGVVKLAGGYGIRKASERDFLQYLGENEDTKQWLVALSAPVGNNGILMASYTHRETDAYLPGADDAKAHQWALGYSYGLGKRTNLYASYAQIKNNGNGSFRFGGRNLGSGSGLNPDMGYQRGISIGIRHLF